MRTFDLSVRFDVSDIPQLPQSVVESPEFRALMQPLVDRFEADVRKLIEEMAAPRIRFDVIEPRPPRYPECVDSQTDCGRKDCPLCTARRFLIGPDGVTLIPKLRIVK